MAIIDKTYHDLLNEILDKGFKYEDPNRKGVHRIQIPTYTFKHDFADGFPAITTKKLYWKGVVGELLWFLRGDTNIKYLVDNGINIWNKDAKNFNKKGNLGRVYGYQLRNFGGKFDQLEWVLDTLKNNPLATKKTVTFINPNDKEHQALSPCHTGFKILVEPCTREEKIVTPGVYHKFTLQWEQDSVDTFLGR